MSLSNRRTVLATAFVLLAAMLAVPTVASAQYREFSGKIDMIKKKKFIVDNRKGDKVSFVFIKSTEVSGEKDSVKKIRKGDWVTVSWKFIDKPRKAYKIVVQPEKEEAGEDQ